VKKDRFISNNIACDVFSGETPDGNQKNAVYFYGFPGSTGQTIVTDFLVNLGFVAIQPHYPGTYESDGKHTPQSAIKSLKEINQIVENCKLKNVKSLKPVHLSSNIEVCVGNSFGAFVALRGASYLSKLKTLILLAPAISYGVNGKGCVINEDGDSHYEYVKRSRPYAYRLGSKEEWLMLYEGKLDFLQKSEHPSLERVIGVIGTNDSSIDIKRLRKFFKEVVTYYVGDRVEIDLLEVQGAGHSANTLLQKDISEKLSRKILKSGFEND